TAPATASTAPTATPAMAPLFSPPESLLPTLTPETAGDPPLVVVDAMADVDAAADVDATRSLSSRPVTPTRIPYPSAYAPQPDVFVNIFAEPLQLLFGYSEMAEELADKE
ncbi:hypothetical protein HDU82_000992, partial [Entophlyctis luteolus]